MGTYVVGGAVLFAIGFITYEIFEAVKSAKTAADNVINTVAQDPVAVANASSAVTPLGAIDYAAGGLGGILGQDAAEWVLSQESN